VILNDSPFYIIFLMGVLDLNQNMRLLTWGYIGHTASLAMAGMHSKAVPRTLEDSHLPSLLSTPNIFPSLF
jgi:hypothetical protein